MSSEHYVEHTNLSTAWGTALRVISETGSKEVGPLTVAVTGFDPNGIVQENTEIRAVLDDLLASKGMQTVDTVANTIFPTSLWDPAKDREVLYNRYRRILSRILHSSIKNRRGIYFARMITGGPKGQENQLEFGISTYLARKGVRRGVLQVGVFNPGLDHSASALLGFPCLQHVTFAPTDEGLCVNAFYATQYMVERAYGNYLGLCRLGRFVAHELNLPLARLTCMTGIAQCEIPKGKLTGVFTAMEEVEPVPKLEGAVA
jgi:hypothetical protein